MTRPFLITFLDLFGAEIQEVAQNAYGHAPYEPGANGTERALKLQPDKFIPFADALALPFGCNTQPEYLQGYYKHKGSDIDTAYVIVTFGEENLFELLFSIDDITDLANEDSIAAYGVLEIIGGEEEYANFEVPIIYNDNGIASDSAFIYLVCAVDSATVANEEAYYVFDEFKFSNNALSVANFKAPSINIYPNPSSHQINIQTGVDARLEEVQLFDITGKLIEQQSSLLSSNHTLDIAHLAAGVYFIDVKIGQDVIREKIIKID